ncbi:MAG: DUF1189 family protein [Patescibacteria group bacterium]
MSIFESIGKSIYSPSYYAHIKDERLSASFSYFVSLAIIVSLVATAAITIRVLPLAKNALQNLGPEVVERFPEGLVVTIKNQQVSTNVSGAVAIPFNLGTTTLNLPTNFLVIDTENPFDETRFRNASTVLYLTKDTLYGANEDGGIEQSEKVEIPDVTIDRATVLRWLGELTPILTWLPFIFVFAVFFAALWLISLVLLELLLAALVIMLTSRIRGESLSYKESYQISLHAVTLRVLLGTVAVIGPGFLAAFVFMPFLGVAMSLIIFWINTSESLLHKKNETPIQ